MIDVQSSNEARGAPSRAAELAELGYVDEPSPSGEALFEPVGASTEDHVIADLDDVERQPTRVGIGHAEKARARIRTLDPEEGSRGEGLGTERQRAVAERGERGVEVIKVRVTELEDVDRHLQERAYPARRFLLRAESRAEEGVKATRKDDDVTAFERRANVGMNAEASLAKSLLPRGLLHATFGVVRASEERPISPVLANEEGAVLHEHRIVCAVDEGDGEDGRSQSSEEVRQRPVLLRRATWFDRAHAHVRVDRPRDLVTTSAGSTRRTAKRPTAWSAHDELGNGWPHRHGREQLAGRRHPCFGCPT